MLDAHHLLQVHDLQLLARFRRCRGGSQPDPVMLRLVWEPELELELELELEPELELELELELEQEQEQEQELELEQDQQPQPQPQPQTGLQTGLHLADQALSAPP